MHPSPWISDVGIAFASECSYAELSAVPRAFVRPPKRFLSHAWERPFHELVEHLMATEKAAAARERDVGSGVGEDEWLQVSVWIGACSSSHAFPW